MFEKRKQERKLKAFREGDVELVNYNEDEGIITLEARRGIWKWTADLASKLVEFDGKTQLAFSGDVIASDGEAISCVMKVMWNSKLPKPFLKSNVLRKQLGKADSEENLDTDDLEENLYTAESLVNEPTPIYFRDMADRVAGMPNEVVVTVKASYRIDK